MWISDLLLRSLCPNLIIYVFRTPDQQQQDRCCQCCCSFHSLSQPCDWFPGESRCGKFSTHLPDWLRLSDSQWFLGWHKSEYGQTIAQRHQWRSLLISRLPVSLYQRWLQALQHPVQALPHKVWLTSRNRRIRPPDWWCCHSKDWR